MRFHAGLSVRAAAASALLLTFCAWCSTGRAEETTPQPPAADDAQLAAPAADGASAPAKDEPSEEDAKGWQIFFAAANLWPRLEESEGKVDTLLNNGLGRLFPRWEEPRTFKDWRDDFMLWDFQIGVGREINENWVWYGAVGGTLGRQGNSEKYFFTLPVRVDVDFRRTVLLATTGVDWYFNGQPSWSADKTEMKGFWGHLRAAKPYVEFTTGYVDLKGICSGTLRTLHGAKLFRYEDKARYDLFFVSPRIGIDIPINERDSFSIQAGPLFFTSHNREFDNISVYGIIRHRF